MGMRWWAALLPLAGCVVVEHSETLEDLEIDVPIRHVIVDLNSGDLTLEVGGQQAVVSRTLRYTGDEPMLDARVEGDTLVLELRCRALQRVCSADHHVRLPETVSLDASLGSGALVASGVTGDVFASTGSGEVSLSEVSGKVEVSVGSGEVAIAGITGTLVVDGGSGEITITDADVVDAYISSGSGEVDATFVGRPTEVGVDVGSGDVRLVVPAGAYRIETDTGSGDVVIDGLTADRSAESTLRVETGSGDVRLLGR